MNVCAVPGRGIAKLHLPHRYSGAPGYYRRGQSDHRAGCDARHLSATRCHGQNSDGSGERFLRSRPGGESKPRQQRKQCDTPYVPDSSFHELLLKVESQLKTEVLPDQSSASLMIAQCDSITRTKNDFRTNSLHSRPSDQQRLLVGCGIVSGDQLHPQSLAGCRSKCHCDVAAFSGIDGRRTGAGLRKLAITRSAERNVWSEGSISSVGHSGPELRGVTDCDVAESEIPWDKADLWSEGEGALQQEVEVSGGSGFRDGDVHSAVAVQVRGRAPFRLEETAELNLILECAVPVPQEKSHLVRRVIGSNDVELSIAVKVADVDT